MLLLCPALAWGGAFEVAEQGATTGGLAHAGTALRGDAESAWFNPAALTDGRGFRSTLGLSLAWSRVRATSTPEAAGEPWTATSNTPLGTPPYAYLSYAQADWAVSLAANVPFGGGIRWPAGWAQRYDSLQSKPQFFRVGATFAYRFGPVALGAGVHVDTGSLVLRRATDHVSQDGELLLYLRGTGVGGDGYVHVEVGPHATIGASYKSRTALAFRGEADFEVPAPFASTYPDQTISSAYTLPDRAALAFAWTEDRWRVVVEGGVTFWSTNDALAVDFSEDVTPDTTQQNRWRNAGVVRLAASGRPHEIVEVRVGGYVDGIPGAPAPTDTLGPSSPDGTRVAGTLGVGVDVHPRVRVDLFGEGIAVLGRTSTSLDAPEASYRGVALAGGVGFTANVPARAPRALAIPELPGEVAPTEPAGEVGGVLAPEVPAEPAPPAPPAPTSPWTPKDETIEPPPPPPPADDPWTSPPR